MKMNRTSAAAAVIAAGLVASLGALAPATVNADELTAAAPAATPATSSTENLRGHSRAAAPITPKYHKTGQSTFHPSFQPRIPAPPLSPATCFRSRYYPEFILPFYALLHH